MMGYKPALLTCIGIFVLGPTVVDATQDLVLVVMIAGGHQDSK